MALFPIVSIQQAGILCDSLVICLSYIVFPRTNANRVAQSVQCVVLVRTTMNHGETRKRVWNATVAATTCLLDDTRWWFIESHSTWCHVAQILARTSIIWEDEDLTWPSPMNTLYEYGSKLKTWGNLGDHRFYIYKI